MGDRGRVTGSGEFFAPWAMVYFWQCFFNYVSGPIFCLCYFFAETLRYITILKNTHWATFWGAFSQNHLVALARGYILICTYIDSISFLS
jgi:hypothetical protein